MSIFPVMFMRCPQHVRMTIGSLSQSFTQMSLQGQEQEEVHDRCPGSRGNSALENPVQQLQIVRLSMHGSIAAQIGLWSTFFVIQASLTQTTR